MKNGKPKQVLFVGNCIAADLANFFRKIDCLADEYQFKAWELHINMAPTPELVAVLPNAHAVFILDIVEAQAARAHFVPNEVTCHAFPLYLRRTYWPFDTLVFGKDELGTASAINGGYVRFPDGLLGRLRTEIPNKSARFDSYKNLTIGGAVPRNFVRMNEIEEETYRHIDEKYGTKIGDFVIARSKYEQTHHWLGHYAGSVYGLLMEYCMAKLGIRAPLPDFDILNVWSQMQVPVHPIIGEQLGLEWVTEERLYMYGPTGPINWSEYIQMYINQLG